MGMKDKQLAKEIAERRMIMIAPLIGALLSVEEYYRKRREISEMYDVSTRTLQRYVDAYNESGIDGLEPQGRVPEQNPVISKEHFARIEAEARAESGPDVRVPHFDTTEGVKVPAAWMIERCGLKGRRLGGVRKVGFRPCSFQSRSTDRNDRFGRFDLHR